MAKRKNYRRARAKTRTVYRKAPTKRRRSKKSGLKGEIGIMLGAGLYGALRSRVSNMVAPYTSFVPGGAVADEISMLLAMYGAKKVLGNKVPMLNDVIKAGKVIEYARIGETISMGGLNAGFLSGNKTSSSLNATVFV